MMSAHVRVSVSKRGEIQMYVLIDGVWTGIILDDGEPSDIVMMLQSAQEKSSRMRSM